MTKQEEMKELDEGLETAITGRRWKDCERCGRVRIEINSKPPYCSDCGGEIVNCLTCGTGKHWWYRQLFGFKCLTCGGNPLKGNGRSDWKDISRARMVKMFGPRREGDIKLLERYRGEL